jgi:hypothetical protein
LDKNATVMIAVITDQTL